MAHNSNWFLVHIIEIYDALPCVYYHPHTHTISPTDCYDDFRQANEVFSVQQYPWLCCKYCTYVSSVCVVPHQIQDMERRWRMCSCFSILSIDRTSAYSIFYSLYLKLNEVSQNIHSGMELLSSAVAQSIDSLDHLISLPPHRCHFSSIPLQLPRWWVEWISYLQWNEDLSRLMAYASHHCRPHYHYCFVLNLGKELLWCVWFRIYGIVISLNHHCDPSF